MHQSAICKSYAIDQCNCNPEKLIKINGHHEPKELAKMIIEEAPDSIELFGTLEEMIEYISEAMRTNYVPSAETASKND